MKLQRSLTVHSVNYFRFILQHFKPTYYIRHANSSIQLLHVVFVKLPYNVFKYLILHAEFIEVKMETQKIHEFGLW